MRFEEFASLHGLILGSLVEGRWVRVATTDHPKKRNGAYKFMGDIGWVQNHATSTEVSTWRPDVAAPAIDNQAIANRAAEFERQQAAGWQRAAHRASALLKSAKPGPHGYLQRKGLVECAGLVLPDEVLMVPMRSITDNAIVGAQLIQWMPDERVWEKKMLPGMRAKGAVFRIGPHRPSETFLCEGYATGLSIELASRLMRLNAAVLVCFSDGNLAHVASMVHGRKFVVADNDKSGAGERAAVKSGLPYCMSPVLGEDANDMHVRAGLFELGAMLLRARRAEVVVA